LYFEVDINQREIRGGVGVREKLTTFDRGEGSIKEKLTDEGLFFG